ncbi:hypothetical protein [Flavobacterium sp. KACC 22761]|uniref:hypothetical protein n=1 Tax=Flavobacterium sp. KACC 22761 TaxID=3092665 RepID=UPI002A75C0BB|nr:hypothetical protein [Flavobacterium sp. KACC 22761]WPO78017.1 hypothetical protein SCB73_17245 [Flavobacterium sp. KACC 22761]
MRIFTIAISFLFFLSCTNQKKDISNQDLNVLLNKSIREYFQTKDKRILNSAYEELKYNKDYVEIGLSGNNSLPIISLLLNLKKYDELEQLLSKNNTINEYNRVNTLNIVKFLKINKKNKREANSYIYENIDRIKDSLKKTPRDSLLYADYFSMKMFLKGKKNALKEIDSMKATNKDYSELFYEGILKESIKNYPDESLGN